ncbi:hypothetical protein QR680_001695 [Steinernema hermaphroditum]|uniref:Autophagy-related protein 2 n=1 Tax=Steinernema hermaphroditum TaxID=289476 RepID=A0AA39H1F5_9BILA|nr:hypothetical protein QR680_001695 [Steinernema hermaphroditum]
MTALQESLVGFLINRYLGDLFVGKCEIDNLKVKLSEGYASVSELELNTQYINENLEKCGINLQLMEGYIGNLTAKVPFTSLLEKSSEFIIDDLLLCFQPRSSGPVGAINDIVSSMIGSMATSRELAKEFFATESAQQKDGGVESCEQLIAAMMSRIVLKVTNAVLRMENSSTDSEFITAIECHIDSARFVDEQLEACESQSRELRTITSEPKSIFSIASLNKLLHLTGVNFYTDISSKLDDPVMSVSQQYTSIYQRRERERNKSKCSSSRTTEEFDFDFAQSMQGTIDSFQSCYSHISTDESLPRPVASTSTEKLLSDPIKFGHLVGDDNIAKFSTSNSAVNAHPENCPKNIDIELNFQGIELFINPSQIFIVKEIMNLLLMPKDVLGNEDATATGGRLMNNDDFRNIEYQMQNNAHFQGEPIRTAHGNLAGGQWAGNETFQMTVRNREEEIVDEEFDNVNLYSLNNDRNRRLGALGSSMSSESSYETRTLCDSDKADTTRLKASIASVVMIIPHKDPWTADVVNQKAKGGLHATMEALQEARERSEKFFSTAAGIRVKGITDLKVFREKFSALYSGDHILITGWPFNIDCTITKEPQNERTDLIITVSQLDCSEFLTASSINGASKHAHFDIFTFDGICEANSANFILKMEASSGKDVRNNIILSLGDCCTELDASIIDRLSDLIAPNPFFAVKKKSPIQYDLHLNEDPFAPLLGVEHDAKPLNFELRMPSWTVDFRIPKADLRSADSSNRLSYRVKNVHPEVLKLRFDRVNLKLPKLNPEKLDLFWELKLTCSSLTGSFEGDPSVLKCSEEEQTFLYASRECFIRENEEICIELKYDKRNRSLTTNNTLNSAPTDPMMRSVWGSFFQSNEHKDGPFSQKVVMRDNETLTMVGEREELMDFGDACRSKSNLLLNINAPTLNVALPSHMFFEVLYNRLLNDLLLWQPCSPVFKGDVEEQQESSNQNFQPCKSTFERDSDSESDDSTAENTDENEGNPHDVAVTFDVDRFSVLIGTTIEDSLGIAKGQIRGQLKKTQLFVVSGYHGDPNLAYFYISSDSIGVYHQNLYEGVTPYATDVSSPNFASRTSTEIVCIEPLEDDCPFIHFLDDHRFALSMKIECGVKDNVIVKKDLLVTAALQNSQLHVNLFQHASDYWVNQLLDFFKVTDYEVPGYVLPECVYQVRFNARSTLMSYAHNQIRETSNLRLKLAIGSCDLSCQIVDDQQTVRFQSILENSKLYASNELPPRSTGVHFDDDYRLPSAELYTDYDTFITLVCLGYFEFEFSLGSDLDESSGLRKPRFDIRCKNDEVKAYFCSDSLSMLINVFSDIFNSELMKASEVGTPNPSEASSNSGLSAESDQCRKHQTNVNQQNMTAVQEEILKDHLSNAMIDVQPQSISSPPSDKLNQNYAFFPEEESLEKYPPRTSTDCEAFCSIDEHPGHAVMGPSGDPYMRPFGSSYTGKRQSGVATRQERFYKASDFSRPNGAFLVQGSLPIVNINIKDITLRLFIFGGSDFGMEESETKTYSGDARDRERKRGSKDLVKGGSFRDETVMIEFLFHKLSYRNERYGPESDVVSACMVSMYNMEIIDHLCVSKIKQMLYQDKSSDCHRRSNVPILALRQVTSKKQGAKVLINALPIRMNIDQDSLEFLIDFFTEVSEYTVLPDEAVAATEDRVVTEVKVKSNFEDSESESSQPLDDDHSYLFDENDINFDEDHDKLIDLNFGSPDTAHSVGEEAREDQGDDCMFLLDTIIKEFTFSPAVTIKIDYVGKRVKTDNGALMGLLIGMSNLHCTEIRLKELNTRKGVATLGRCFQYAAGEWLNDIRNHQLPNIFGSYGPLSSITQLAGGVRDLVVLPVDEFRKADGHVVKGIQRGAGSFSVSALAAVVDFTQGIASAIQGISEIAFHIVSPDYPNYDPNRRRTQQGRSKIPNDLRAGLSMAFDTVRDGVYDTADVLQMAVQEDRAEGQWFRRLLQQLAPTVIRPIVFGSRATVHVLGGLRSQLQPEQHVAEMRKWRD